MRLAARRRGARGGRAERSASARVCAVVLIVWTASPLRGAWADRDSAYGGRTYSASASAEVLDVVLLHGLGRSATNLALLEWRLAARGYRVCNIDYETRVAELDQAVDDVARGLSDCGLAGRPAHFVTHSLGSLVLRALFARGLATRGGRAVLLAPPSSGSEIVDRLAGAGWLVGVMGPLASQLGTASEALPSRLPPPPIPFGVIAGDRWINPLGALWLPAPHDGTVSVARTGLTGMCDHVVMPYTHTFIVLAGPVADQVDAFLRAGRFRLDLGHRAYRVDRVTVGPEGAGAGVPTGEPGTGWCRGRAGPGLE